jgi:hypothetical protein
MPVISYIGTNYTKAQLKITISISVVHSPVIVNATKRFGKKLFWPRVNVILGDA